MSPSLASRMTDVEDILARQRARCVPAIERRIAPLAARAERCGRRRDRRDKGLDAAMVMILARRALH